MEKKIVTIWVMIVVASLVTMAKAAPVEWAVADGGNGHYYDVINVSEGITWVDSKTAAKNLTLLGLTGWHLATITSSEENSFVVGLIASQVDPDENVLIGGFQPDGSPEPAGGWQWVTGEPWVYTNWHSTEPSNHPYPPGENCLEIKPERFGRQWNDLNDYTLRHNYLVEYEAEPACELIAEEIASMEDSHSGGGVVSYDGKLYVWAGYTNYGPTHYNRTPKMEIYDPDTDTWSLGADIPQLKSSAACFELNGKFYTVGGETNPSSSFTKTVHRYNPDTDTWVQMNDFPRRIWQGKAVVCCGKAYVFGGASGYGMPSSAVHEYDEASDAWIPKASMLTGVSSPAVVCFDNKIWVFGGASYIQPYQPTVITKEIQVYDCATNTWAYCDDMPWKVTSSQAVVYNNDIWLFTSAVWDEGIGDWIENEYAYKFSPGCAGTGEWTSCAFTFTPPIKPGYGSKLGLIDGYTYFTDTHDTTTGIDSERAFKVQIGEPVCGEWELLNGELNTPRHGLTGEAINGYIYSICGGNASNSWGTNIIEKYDPSTDTWEYDCSTKVVAARHSLSSDVVDGCIYAIAGHYINSRSENDIFCGTCPPSWQSGAAVYARSGPGVAAYNGELYVFGGNHRSTILSRFDIYNPATNTWRIGGNMPAVTEPWRAVTLSDKIYLTAGGHVDPKKVWCYDPVADTWDTSIPLMNVSRAQCELQAVNGRIYAIGGKDGSGAVSSVESWAPGETSWRTEPSLNIARYQSASAVIGNDIYVFGGYNDGDLASTEVLRMGPCNNPPVAICQDVTVEADSNCQGIVLPEDVNDGSFDPDGDAITLSLEPAGPYPLGETSVTLTVSDGQESATCEATVTVEDVTPPEFSLSVEPNVLWPPNHTMVEITPTWTASDNCDESPDVTLVSITSNEEDDAKGDGHTSDDIQVDDNGIWLRAERSGKRAGRVYTITYQAVDGSGNVTVQSATVSVPHDQD